MKQALHIFQKDVRYFRYEIGFTLLVVAAFCFVGIRNERGPGPVASILPVTWWFLIARVIHAESLTDSRQFWLTRPYQWRSLLGAKTLFILSFINFPFLVAGAAIVHAGGFSVSKEITGLLWIQVLLSFAFVLPAAAISVITGSLAEFLAVTLLMTVGILARLLTSPLMNWGSYWMEFEWVKTYFLIAVITTAAGMIVIRQYARHETFAARAMAVSTVVILLMGSALLPWTTAFALQTHFSRQNISSSSIRIELDQDRKWSGRIYFADQNRVVAELPLRVKGLPARMEIKPNGVTMTMRASDGEMWVDNESPPYSFSYESGITSLRAVMTSDAYTRLKNQPLLLRGTLYFTLYGNKQSTFIPLNTKPVPVNGLGLCSAGPASYSAGRHSGPNLHWLLRSLHRTRLMAPEQLTRISRKFRRILLFQRTSK